MVKVRGESRAGRSTTRPVTIRERNVIMIIAVLKIIIKVLIVVYSSKLIRSTDSFSVALNQNQTSYIHPKVLFTARENLVNR